MADDLRDRPKPEGQRLDAPRKSRLDRINAKKPAKLLDSKSLTLCFSGNQTWPVFLCYTTGCTPSAPSHQPANAPDTATTARPVTPDGARPSGQPWWLAARGSGLRVRQPQSRTSAAPAMLTGSAGLTRYSKGASCGSMPGRWRARRRSPIRPATSPVSSPSGARLRGRPPAPCGYRFPGPRRLLSRALCCSKWGCSPRATESRHLEPKPTPLRTRRDHHL